MKRILGVVAIVLLMILSYTAGRRHMGRPAAEGRSAHLVLYWVDPMHPDYKSDHPGIAPDCGMQLEPVYGEDAGKAPRAAALAQLPPGGVSIDGATQGFLGIKVAPVEKSGAPHIIRVVGRVVPEDTRVYRINSGADGFIRETYNDSVGEFVKKDQKLATSYTNETLAVASGFLAASAGVPGANGKDGARTVPFPGTLAKQGSSSVQGYTDRLRNLGVSDVQIKQIAESGQLPQSIDIVAPADGFIVARNITPGQHFEHSMEFYRIADLSRVWIMADIFGSDAQGFRPGTIARATLPGQGKTFSARVTSVLPQVDPATQTLKLRLEVDNPALALRPDMYVDVELPVAMRAGLTVPQDAVLDSGREQRVFVERSSGVFEPRRVQTGWRLGDRVQIVHGLVEGERVVAAGTFLVDSESRMRSSHPASFSAPGSAVQPDYAVIADSRDPVCGMKLDPAAARSSGHVKDYHGEAIFFCSDSCQKKFEHDPGRYRDVKVGHAAPPHQEVRVAND